MEQVYCEARSEEVFPEVRAAAGGASDRLDMERFVRELEEDLAVVNDGAVGLARGACTRQQFAHFARIQLCWPLSS